MKDLWVKISYWWFVIMLFIVGLFSGKLKVNAASLTPTSSQFDARYSTFNCSVSGHNCVLTDGGSWVGTTNMGSAITGPTNQTYNQLSLKYYYSSNFVAGNTYIFKIRINTTYPDFDNINKFVLLNVRGGTSTSSLDSGNIQSSALISKTADTENDKVYYMTFSITPLVNIKYIWIYVGYKPISQVFKNGVNVGNIVVKNSGVSYTEGIGSQIDQQTQIIKEQTEIIIDVKDTITDDNVDNPSSFIEDMEDLLPSNGVITQLITLPITLYQKVLNSINGTCSQFDLGALYGTHLIMPCINLQTYLGSTLWNTIDLIMSGVFVLVIARKMVKAFNSFTFMKEGDVIND